MTTIVTNLTLEAYRGISGLELSGLTGVTLLVGANNVGKSSILEAVALLLRPPDGALWRSVVMQRDEDIGFVDGLWAIFPGAQALHPDSGMVESQALRIQGNTRGIEMLRTFVARCEVNQEEGMASSGRIHLSVDGQPEVTIKFAPPVGIRHDIPQYRVVMVTPATHYSTRTLVNQLSAVVREGKKEQVVEAIAAFDEDVTDLDVVTFSGGQGVELADGYSGAATTRGNGAIFLTHKTRGVVDLGSFGDGMRRTVALALALGRASEGALLVDEIDAGLHPSMFLPVFTQLLRVAQASKTQIIATTHSLEAVDAMLSATSALGGAEDFCAFWLKRTKSGHEAKRYAYEKLTVLREGGLDIR